jgi:Coenzyme PQQ synthesis protein D (PqqD)
MDIERRVVHYTRTIIPEYATAILACRFDLSRLHSLQGGTGIRYTDMSFHRRHHMIVTANRDHLVAELSGETVILHVQNGMYYGLNKLGTRVWNLIQEPRTIDELLQTILNEYEVEREEAERDLVALVSNLASKGLAEIA